MINDAEISTLKKSYHYWKLDLTTYLRCVRRHAANTLKIYSLIRNEKLVFGNQQFHDVSFFPSQAHSFVLASVCGADKEKVWVCNQISHVVYKVASMESHQKYVKSG